MKAQYFVQFASGIIEYPFAENEIDAIQIASIRQDERGMTKQVVAYGAWKQKAEDGQHASQPAPIPPAVLDAATKAAIAKGYCSDWASAKIAEAALEAANIAKLQAAADALPGLVAALEQVTALARIKYGNLDPDVDAYLTEVEAMVIRAKGGAR